MFSPPRYPEPSRPPGAWTLASYNAHDLFDTVGEPRNEHLRLAENELRNKLTRLGRALHVLDADVVGLMEVETLAVLQRLNRDALSDLGYREAILLEGNDPERGIDVALLSRFPVSQVVSHAQETWIGPDGVERRLFSRDCLECHVSLPGGDTLVVLVNHFKSKRGGEAESQALRTAQAARVRAIADDLWVKFPLVAVVGDLNDTPGSDALHPVLSGDYSDLAAWDVPEANCYSFVHQGQPERIDYMLASPGLARRFVPGSVLMPHDDWARRASDHTPIRAAFGLTDALLPPYEENLTAAYDREHSPRPWHRRPPHINADHFYADTLHPLQGRLVIVTGWVAHIEVTHGTGVLRLSLGRGDPARAFRVTIHPHDFSAFVEVGIPDIAGYYNGHQVRGVGELHFTQEVPELVITHPRQLRRIHT